jgi:hypothetical protein
MGRAGRGLRSVGLLAGPVAPHAVSSVSPSSSSVKRTKKLEVERGTGLLELPARPTRPLMTRSTSSDFPLFIADLRDPSTIKSNQRRAMPSGMRGAGLKFTGLFGGAGVVISMEKQFERSGVRLCVTA